MQIFLSAICLLLISSAYAVADRGDASISGSVVDKDGKPVSHANIIIVGTSFGTVTDDNGAYKVDFLLEGVYTLKIDHIVYESVEIKNLQLSNSENIDLGTIILAKKHLEMDEVIVSAIRADKSVEDVSRHVNVVSSREIEERNASNPAEALRDELGVAVQKTSHGGGSAVIRGLKSNQILLLVDGIRMNNSIYRKGNHQYLATVDPAMTEQIEVVRGPSSVNFGSDAMGGSINIVTESPVFDVDNPIHYKLISGFSSADNSSRTSLRLNLSPKSNLAVVGGISYRDMKDLRRGARSDNPLIENSTNGLYQSPSGFSSFDSDGKIIFVKDEDKLILGYQHSERSEVPRYDKYEQGYSGWVYSPQKRDLAYLKTSYSVSQIRYLPADNLNMTLSLSKHSEGKGINLDPQFYFTTERDTVQTRGASIQFNLSHGRHFISYGGDVYIDNIDSYRTKMKMISSFRYGSIRARYPDGSNYRSRGIFFLDEYNISKDFILNSGIRRSDFSTEFELTGENDELLAIDQSYNAMTGNIGIVYKFNGSVRLTSNIASGFRAPNISDLAKLGESKGNIYEVPNPDLKPENILTGDVGINLASSVGSMSISLYRSQITNLISNGIDTYNGSSITIIDDVEYIIKSKQNLGEADIAGIESLFRYNLDDKISFNGNLTVTKGTNTTLYEPLSGIQPTFGRLGVRYTGDGTSFDVYSRFAAKQDRLSADDLDDPRIPEGGSTSWYTINARATKSVNNYISLTAGIENILDLNYREHGSGINAPGRNLFITLRLAN